MNTDHYGPTFATRDDLKVIACYSCARKHLDPLPNPKDLAQFYADPDGFYAKSDAWFKTEADHHRLGLWDPAYRFETQMMFRHLGEIHRLVDLGAGAGWFIQWWIKNNGLAIGVEPSPVARAHSPVAGRLVPYLTGAKHKFAEGQPVIIRARLVLEHLADPVGFLKEVAALPYDIKGISITVPNDFNSLQKRLIDRDGTGYWFVDKTHVSYFDRRGLTYTLREAGFEPVWWGATFPMEVWQLWLGQKYIEDDRVGQQVHLARLNFEQKLGGLAFRIYKILFDWLGWGREIICLARLR